MINDHNMQILKELSNSIDGERKQALDNLIYRLQHNEHNHYAAEAVRPAVYGGRVTGAAGDDRPVLHAANYWDVPLFFERFGNWVVSNQGINSLEQDYFIAKERIFEPDWERHMSRKQWVDESSFRRALDFAREHFSKEAERLISARDAFEAQLPNS